jgi:hypothetical protein
MTDVLSMIRLPVVLENNNFSFKGKHSSLSSQIRLTPTPKPYGIDFLTVFGWSDRLWRYICLSVGFSYSFVFKSPLSKNSIWFLENLSSIFILGCIEFARSWNFFNVFNNSNLIEKQLLKVDELDRKETLKYRKKHKNKTRGSALS